MALKAKTAELSVEELDGILRDLEHRDIKSGLGLESDSTKLIRRELQRGREKILTSLRQSAAAIQEAAVTQSGAGEEDITEQEMERKKNTVRGLLCYIHRLVHVCKEDIWELSTSLKTDVDLGELEQRERDLSDYRAWRTLVKDLLTKGVKTDPNCRGVDVPYLLRELVNEKGERRG